MYVFARCCAALAVVVAATISPVGFAAAQPPQGSQPVRLHGTLTVNIKSHTNDSGSTDDFNTIATLSVELVQDGPGAFAWVNSGRTSTWRISVSGGSSTPFGCGAKYSGSDSGTYPTGLHAMTLQRHGTDFAHAELANLDFGYHYTYQAIGGPGCGGTAVVPSQFYPLCPATAEGVIGAMIDPGPGKPLAFNLACSDTTRDTTHTTATTVSGSLTGGIVTADPGQYSPVTRVEQVTLDGSRSTSNDGSPITEYRWHLEPANDCPPGTALARANFNSSNPRLGPFIVLCGLVVSLEVVTGNGSTDSATTTVSVKPRGAPFIQTPFSDEEDNFGQDTQAVPPGDGVFAHGEIDGRNVSTCDPRPNLDLVFCPQPDPATGSWRRSGAYALMAVPNGDPGPFRGFSYVSDTNLQVLLRGVVGQELTAAGQDAPGAGTNLYSYNQAHNRAEFDAYVNAVREHENNGDGHDPQTGHASATLAALRDARNPINDPRKYIEKLIGANDNEEQTAVQGAINTAEDNLGVAAADQNIHRIGSTYTVYWWVPLAHDWYPYTCTVGGGDAAGCVFGAAHGGATPESPGPGSRARLDAGTFIPGENVRMELHSAVFTLGTVRADNNGQVHASIVIPPGVPPGRHSIVLTGMRSGIIVTVPVTIAQPSASRSGLGGGSGPQLADTGSRPWPAVELCLALLFSGALVLAAAQYRKSRPG